MLFIFLLKNFDEVSSASIKSHFSPVFKHFTLTVVLSFTVYLSKNCADHLKFLLTKVSKNVTPFEGQALKNTFDSLYP